MRAGDHALVIEHRFAGQVSHHPIPAGTEVIVGDVRPNNTAWVLHDGEVRWIDLDMLRAEFQVGDTVTVLEGAGTSPDGGGYVTPAVIGLDGTVIAISPTGIPEVDFRLPNGSVARQYIHSNFLTKKEAPVTDVEKVETRVHTEPPTEVERLRAELAAEQARQDEWFSTVARIANEAKREYDWCGVFEKTMRDMGLGHMLPRQTLKFEVTVTTEPGVTHHSPAHYYRSAMKRSLEAMDEEYGGHWGAHGCEITVTLMEDE